MSTAEITKARSIIKAAIAQGFAVSLSNGEEYTVKRSTNINDFKGEVGTTGIDVLLLRDVVSDLQIGRIWLVYGNSVEELICDYSDNPAMEQFLASIGEA